MEKILICGKCEGGKVKVIIKESVKQVSTKIYSCNNCKYRYGFKELENLKEAD